MNASPYMYPPDLVDKIFGADTPNLSLPVRTALRELLETTFFASLSTEEGERSPLALVFAPFEELTTSPREWRCQKWVPERLSLVTLRKWAALCDLSSETFLLVELRPRGDLWLSGIAWPTRPALLFKHSGELLVSAPAPGALQITWKWTVTRYERGSVPPQPDRFPDHFLANLDDMPPGHEVSELLRGLASAVAAQGRGGLLIFHPHTASPADRGQLLEKRLDLGDAYCEWLAQCEFLNREQLADDASAAWECQPKVEAAWTALQRAQQQVVRFAGLDGGLLFSGLQLVAFGCKFEAQIDDERLKQLGLQNRGTRHRTAAAMADSYPGTLVVCVSQDGHVLTFFRHDVLEIRG